MDTLTMARRKKEVTPNRQLAQAILDQYPPQKRRGYAGGAERYFRSYV